MQRNIVACVTAQISCKEIIYAASKLAKLIDANLIVVTSQKDKAEAKCRANDLKVLNKLSHITGCDIDIIYSENPTTALVSYINKLKPYHIFIGSPKVDRTFYNYFVNNSNSVPISIVNTKNTCSVPICIS